MLKDQTLQLQEDLTDDLFMSQALLSISNDLASTRTKDDLVDVLLERLKVLVPFDDILITIFNKEKQNHYIWAHRYHSYRIIHPAFDTYIMAEFPLADNVLNVIHDHHEPIVFDIDEMVEAGLAPGYMQYYKENGLAQLVGVVMRSTTSEVGGFFLTSTKKGNFRKEHLSIIKGISSQLCIAASNVLANEIILKHQEEKSILLNLSNDMAAIRNKGGLLAMVQERLKALIYFSHAVTVVAEQETQTYRSLVVDPGSRSKDYPGFHRIVYSDYSLDHPLIKAVLASKEPMVFDLDSISTTKDLPEWILMNYKCGIKEMAIAPLFNGEELIGLFILFSDLKHLLAEKELRLIQGISWQLSVAVGNILANEHIIERDNEKSALLDLSKNFAVIRNKDELHKIINLKLKKLLSISHVITFSISDDGKWYTAYSLDPNSISKGHKDYTTITSSRYQVNDGILNIILASQTPLVYDLDEVIKWPSVPKYLQMNYDVGIREAILAPLKDGEKSTGILIILMNEKSKLNQNYLNLIQGISDQLSIAVANIKANEKIEQQLIEINLYKKQLEEENLYLQEEILTTHNYSELIGNSPVMKKIFGLVSRVAESDSSVLILGETGTGKELIARAIHNTSLRKDKVMIKVNCATLPANLIESELFGHERGSFTGATEKRIGKFELANNSTLFLDEVGELPLDLQVKLLRVLQEKEIERVGGRTTIKTNVRIIAATNRDLQKEVQMGSFRSDLFFRLNVFPINIPSLRERKEDIPLLATHFLAKHAKKSMKSNMSFSAKVIRQLIAYEWPGNVRELEHLVERSVLLSNGRVVEQVYLPAVADEDETLLPEGSVKTIDEVEREHIISVLKRCNGKVSGAGGAAELLKIPATTLSSKILRLKIGKGLSSE